MLQNTWVYDSCCTGFPLKSTHQHIQGLPCLWNMSLSFLNLLWTPLANWNGNSLVPFGVLPCFSGLCNAVVGAEIPPQISLPGGKKKRSFSVMNYVHSHHQRCHCLMRRPALKSPLDTAWCRSTTAIQMGIEKGKPSQCQKLLSHSCLWHTWMDWAQHIWAQGFCLQELASPRLGSQLSTSPSGSRESLQLCGMLLCMSKSIDVVLAGLFFF